MKNDFFYYNKWQRVGILILLSVIALLLMARPLFRAQQDPRITVMLSDSLFMRKCDSFRSTLREEERRVYSQRTAPVAELYPFDPNTLDSAGFVRLGLPSWLARNIIRYREKGGRFRTPEKFARIYGLDSARYQRLLPYIRIDSLQFVNEAPRFRPDTLARDYPEKFKEQVVIELNGADTATLKRVPGIGSGFASMLVAYRQRLGGYHSVTQLLELRGMTDSLFIRWEPWFEADPGKVTPIEVNRAGITRLRNHPYLNFYQAKVIYELRRERGKLHHISELELLEEFSAGDLERLTPYLDFD